MIAKPSAIIPLVMSAAALTTVIVHIIIAGTAPQPDEGTAAHIWQLLMAGQIPFIIHYLIKWVLQVPKRALPVLMMQIGSALAAICPIYLLGW